MVEDLGFEARPVTPEPFDAPSMPAPVAGQVPRSYMNKFYQRYLSGENPSDLLKEIAVGGDPIFPQSAKNLILQKKQEGVDPNTIFNKIMLSPGSDSIYEDAPPVDLNQARKTTQAQNNKSAAGQFFANTGVDLGSLGVSYAVPGGPVAKALGFAIPHFFGSVLVKGQDPVEAAKQEAINAGLMTLTGGIGKGVAGGARAMLPKWLGGPITQGLIRGTTEAGINAGVTRLSGGDALDQVMSGVAGLSGGFLAGRGEVEQKLINDLNAPITEKLKILGLEGKVDPLAVQPNETVYKYLKNPEVNEAHKNIVIKAFNALHNVDLPFFGTHENGIPLETRTPAYRGLLSGLTGDTQALMSSLEKPIGYLQGSEGIGQTGQFRQGLEDLSNKSVAELDKLTNDHAMALSKLADQKAQLVQQINQAKDASNFDAMQQLERNKAAVDSMAESTRQEITRTAKQRQQALNDEERVLKEGGTAALEQHRTERANAAVEAGKIAVGAPVQGETLGSVGEQYRNVVKTGLQERVVEPTKESYKAMVEKTNTSPNGQNKLDENPLNNAWMNNMGRLDEAQAKAMGVGGWRGMLKKLVTMSNITQDEDGNPISPELPLDTVADAQKWYRILGKSWRRIPDRNLRAVAWNMQQALSDSMSNAAPDLASDFRNETSKYATMFDKIKGAERIAPGIRRSDLVSQPESEITAAVRKTNDVTRTASMIDEQMGQDVAAISDKANRLLLLKKVQDQTLSPDAFIRYLSKSGLDPAKRQAIAGLVQQIAQPQPDVVSGIEKQFGTEGVAQQKQIAEDTAPIAKQFTKEQTLPEKQQLDQEAFGNKQALNQVTTDQLGALNQTTSEQTARLEQGLKQAKAPLEASTNLVKKAATDSNWDLGKIDNMESDEATWNKNMSVFKLLRDLKGKIPEQALDEKRAGVFKQIVDQARDENGFISSAKLQNYANRLMGGINELTPAQQDFIKSYAGATPEVGGSIKKVAGVLGADNPEGMLREFSTGEKKFTTGDFDATMNEMEKRGNVRPEEVQMLRENFARAMGAAAQNRENGLMDIENLKGWWDALPPERKAFFGGIPEQKKIGALVDLSRGLFEVQQKLKQTYGDSYYHKVKAIFSARSGGRAVGSEISGGGDLGKSAGGWLAVLTMLKAPKMIYDAILDPNGVNYDNVSALFSAAGITARNIKGDLLGKRNR